MVFDPNYVSWEEEPFASVDWNDFTRKPRHKFP
jgi:hypothetical protein